MYRSRDTGSGGGINIRHTRTQSSAADQRRRGGGVNIQYIYISVT